MIRRTKEKLVLQYDGTVSFFADALMRMRTHEGFRRYFKNTGWLFLGRMFNLLAAFFIGIYIARYLGPAQYGLLNYTVSFVGLFAFLASFGIDGILNRELVKYPEKRDKLLGTGFYIKLVGSALAVFTTLIVSLITNPDTFTNILVFLFSLTFIPQAFNVIDLHFQSQVLSKNVIRVQIASTFLVTLLKLLLIYLGLGVFGLIAIYLFESIIMAIGLIIVFKGNNLRIREWKFDKELAMEMLKNSWPFVLSGAMVAIYSRIDQVMIKSMINDDALGIYSAAVKIFDMWFLIPSLICTSLFPAIINSKKINDALFKKRMKVLYRLLASLAFFIALAMFIFAKEIILFLFGTNFIEASRVLQIYSLALIPTFLGMGVGYYLLAENHVYINLLIGVSAALANIGLNILLIPVYGINGAAIASLISYSFGVILIFLFGHTREHGVLIIKSILFMNDGKHA